MTRAQAFAIVADNVTGLDPDVDRALAVLRPAFEAKRKTGSSGAAKRALAALKGARGYPGNEEARYLDSFGEAGSPEREAQAARLRVLENGPSREAFGCPSAVSWVARGSYDWKDDEARRPAHTAVVDAWRYSEQGQAFEHAQAVHEARRAQFAYVSPKTRKDDERAVFALAVLERTTVEPPALALEVAA